MLAEPLAITLRVIKAFEKLNIPYLIGGSLASALYGTARSTLDADLVAELRPEHVNPLVEILHQDFYIDDGMILDAIQHYSSLKIIHLDTAFKVDVFIAKPRRFDQMQFQRRRLEVVAIEPESRAYVATAEDIVLSKLEWYRQGGETSEQQWRDILGVLKIQAGRLDLGYLRELAAELSVADLLERALREST